MSVINKKDTKFYYSLWFFTFIAVLCPPAAIFLVWKNKKLYFSTQIIASVLLAAIVFFYFSIFLSTFGIAKKSKVFNEAKSDYTQDVTDTLKFPVETEEKESYIITIETEKISETTESDSSETTENDSEEIKTEAPDDEMPHNITLMEPDPAGEILFKRGERVTIKALGKPYSKYTLSVYYKNKSSAKGLGDAVSDAEGYVSWEFKVGAKASIGEDFYFTIDGENSETSKFFFKVTQ